MITDPLCETHSVNNRSYCYGHKTESKKRQNMFGRVGQIPYYIKEDSR